MGDIRPAIARKEDKYSRRIDELIDPIALGITCDEWPTREDLLRIWHTLVDADKKLVLEATKPTCVTVGDLFKATLVDDLHKSVDTNSLYNHNILRAILYTKLLRLDSDVARRQYFDTLLDLRKGPQTNYEDIKRVIKTDREHLDELAREIALDGDGKRGLYRVLIAYGMQTREHKAAIYDIDTGEMTKPPIYELADPSIVYRSLQELSKLDGSYREAGKEEADSLESQASRVKRLNKLADVEAEKLGGTARHVTAAEVEEKDD